MIGTILLIIIWTPLIYEGVFGLIKGYFHGEQEKAKKHEPKAYRKWVRLSSVFIVLCGALNLVFSVLDGFSETNSMKYIVYILITVAVTIAASGVAYVGIVKPADKASGITQPKL